MTVNWSFLNIMFAMTVYTVIYTFQLPRRQNFAMRAILTLILLAAAAVGIALLPQAGGVGGFVDSLLACGLCMAGCAICYDTRIIMYLFWCLVGNAAFGLAQCINEVLCFYLQPTGILRVLLEIALNTAVGVLIYFLMITSLRSKSAGSDRFRSYIFYVIVAALYILFAMLDALSLDAMTEIGYLLFRSLLSVLGVCLLYIFAVDEELYSNDRELRVLLEKDKVRYEVSKEYMDMINIKCHDIRQHVRQMQGTQRIDPEYARELEDAIRIYDTDIKTGNEALDVILTEKNRICAEKNIEATFIIDGEKLSFIRPTDLSSLFGNIMDNAIEAVSRLPQDEMKQISLVVSAEAGVIHIREQNYFQGELIRGENQLPVTTKADKTSHGLGLRSIRYIAEKYGGVMNLHTRDNVFLLNIVIPFQTAE